VYLTQHRLSISNQQAVAKGDGWYDDGTLALLSISDTVEPTNGLLGILGSICYFQGRYENGNLITPSGHGSVVMNRPHTLVTRWQLDWSRSLACFLIVVGVRVMVAVIFLSRRRSAMRLKNQTYSNYLPRPEKLCSRDVIPTEVYAKLREEYLEVARRD
jgi:hypothetical protein